MAIGFSHLDSWSEEGTFAFGVSTISPTAGATVVAVMMAITEGDDYGHDWEFTDDGDGYTWTQCFISDRIDDADYWSQVHMSFAEMDGTPGTFDLSMDPNASSSDDYFMGAYVFELTGDIDPTNAATLVAQSAYEHDTRGGNSSDFAASADMAVTPETGNFKFGYAQVNATEDGETLSVTSLSSGYSTSGFNFGAETEGEMQIVAFGDSQTATADPISGTLGMSSGGIYNYFFGVVEFIDTATGAAVEGSATLAYGGQVAGSGTATRLGVAAAVYGGQVAGVGVVDRSGSATLDYGSSVTGTGLATRAGVGALDYGGQVAGTGLAVVGGVGALDYGGQAAGSGLATRVGTAVAIYGGSVSGTGLIPTGTVLGAGALDYGGQVTGSGTPVRGGVGAAVYGSSVTGTGLATRAGGGALDYGSSVTGTGLATRAGVGALDYGYAAVGLIPTGTPAARFGPARTAPAARFTTTTAAPAARFTTTTAAVQFTTTTKGAP